MRKFLPQFLLVTIALVGAGFFFAPHTAHAWNLLDVSGSVADFIYGLIGKVFWFALIPASSWVLYIIGMAIDFALHLTLGNEFFNSEAISITWSIIRDLCNMAFIFVLIWAGLRTILNLNDVNVKKTIINVVIAAVFINFSLFMTKAIIDVSNIATAWFVQGVENIGGGASVSDSVRASLQMDKLTSSKVTGKTAITLVSFIAGFALFVINCVAIYVLFQVADFLIARIVVFIFLLVTSPLAFMGQLEIQSLSEYSGKWWKELKNQAIMAPMFFLMLYITLYIVDGIDTIAFGDKGLPDPVTGSSFNPTNYVMFAIIIFMLLKCLETAEEYAGEMGNQLTGYLKSAAGFATGSLLMGTVGKAASAVAGNKSFQAWSAKSGIIGESAMRAAAGTAGAKFGVSSSFKDLKLDKIGVPGTKDAFKGADKGYAGAVKKEAEEYEKFAKDNLGKGVAGALNRQAFSAGISKRKGGLIGTVLSASGVDLKNKPVLSGLIGDNGKAIASKGIEEKAKDEYDKEVTKAIKKEKDELFDNNKTLDSLTEESEKAKEIAEKITKEFKVLEKDELVLLETLKDYDEAKGTVRGKPVDPMIFRASLDKLRSNWEITKGQKAAKEAEYNTAEESRKNKQKSLENFQDALAKTVLEKAANNNKGISIAPGDSNFKGMERMIKKGAEKISAEDKKRIDDFLSKPADEPKPAAEAAPAKPKEP